MTTILNILLFIFSITSITLSFVIGEILKPLFCLQVLSVLYLLSPGVVLIKNFIIKLTKRD